MTGATKSSVRLFLPRSVHSHHGIRHLSAVRTRRWRRGDSHGGWVRRRVGGDRGGGWCVSSHNLWFFEMATVPPIIPPAPADATCGFPVCRVPACKIGEHFLLAHPPPGIIRLGCGVWLTCGDLWRQCVGQAWRPREQLLWGIGRDHNCTVQLTTPVPLVEFIRVAWRRLTFVFALWCWSDVSEFRGIGRVSRQPFQDRSASA